MFLKKKFSRYQLFAYVTLLSTSSFFTDSASMDAHRDEEHFEALNKLHLLISSTRSPLVKVPEMTIVSSGKMEKIILDTLASHLDFTYEIIPPRDVLSNGYLQLNGSWTGTTGQLQRREVDMCVSWSIAVPSKAKILDNSYPVVFIDSAIIVPFPKENSKLWADTSSFTTSAWIAILVTFVVTIVVSWIIYRVNSSKLGVNVPTFSYWILFYFGLWTSQGMPVRGSSTSFRIVCFVSIFGIYVIMNYFTASYTSLLSTPVYKATVNSIEDLAKSATVKTLLIKGSNTDEYITSSPDPTLKQLADQMVRYPERKIVNAYTVGDIATIIKDDAALIINNVPQITFQGKSNGGSLIENSYKINKKCLVTMAEKAFFGRAQGFTYPKNSPIAKAIDYNLLLMHQAGLIQYAEKSTKSQNLCRISDLKKTQAQKIAPLRRKDMGGPLVTIALGMAFSFFIFLLELIVGRMKKAFARK